jgi:hypothetical protein
LILVAKLTASYAMMSPSTKQMIEIGRDVPVGKVKVEKESMVSYSYFKLCPYIVV